jgi:hypothetical protein
VPLVTWRIDAVALVVVGLFLLPVATGLWKPGLFEGIALTFGYGAYLIATLWYGLR